MHSALLVKAPTSALPLIGLDLPQIRKSADTAAVSAVAVHSYAKDEEIFAEGDRAAFVYKVLSGVVRTSKLLSDGRRQIDAFHLTGDIFGRFGRQPSHERRDFLRLAKRAERDFSSFCSAVGSRLSVQFVTVASAPVPDTRATGIQCRKRTIRMSDGCAPA